jgi:multidrug efflux pump subunit AcrB
MLDLALPMNASIHVTNEAIRRLDRKRAEEFPAAISRITPLALGPPVGWPLRYRVIVPDLSEVREVALEGATVMGGGPERRRINLGSRGSAWPLRRRIDQDEALRLGFSSGQMAPSLNAALSGTIATQVRDGISLIDVVLREVEGQSLSIESPRTLPLPNGRWIPLTVLARFECVQEYREVSRRSRESTLAVQSDVAPGVLPDTVIARLAGPMAVRSAMRWSPSSRPTAR